MADLMDTYWRLPPLSRNIATAVFITSCGVYSGILPGSWFYFHKSLLFKLLPEVWRIPSSFLLTLPKLSILLDPYFLYSYLSQLEVGNPRFSRREDMVWYLSFVSVVVIILDHLAGLYSGFYLQALILALAYTCTQDQRGVKANFFFLTIPAQLVPYSMMLVSLLMVGPGVAMLQLCGLVAAHLYDFLTRLWPEFGGGTNLAPTPAFLTRIVPTPFQRVENRAFGTVFRNAGSGTSGSSSGTSSGPLPDSWKSRGKGNRLGGD
ncbi:hypothetical protein SEUCBS139899_005084 [Sporothrix eucalyptigena]|uniref:Derlin n=1 Tax=Sporothrix eucalyptigena TaxID=1812306 RepID=A0ABP0C8S6_9PEZI